MTLSTRTFTLLFEKKGELLKEEMAGEKQIKGEKGTFRVDSFVLIVL